MEPILIKCKHVNEPHYESADCNLFTPAYGTTATAYGDFGWWYGLVFAFDAETGCHVCVAKDLAIGSCCAKQPVIPKDGFVLMDCGSEYKDAVIACEIGEKAYLYKKKTGYDVALVEPIPEKKAITPKNAETQLASPVINNVSDSGRVLLSEDGMLTWDAVEGATEYTVSLQNAIINGLGKCVLEPTVTENTYVQIDLSTLKTGYAYTLSVYASGKGVVSSKPAYAKVLYPSAQAAQSKFIGKTVVAFGDSLTARPGWVNMLEGYIGTPVINSGVGGDTTVHGMARFQKDVLDKDPDIVLICFGPNDQAAVIKNDYAPNIPLETYRQNMIHFIRECKLRQAKVVLITPHDPCALEGYYVPGAYGLDYAHGNLKQNCEVLRSLAKEYGCGLIDINALTEESDRSDVVCVGDGLHQSLNGHTLWAEVIGNYLLENQVKLCRPSLPTTTSLKENLDSLKTNAETLKATAIEKAELLKANAETFKSGALDKANSLKATAIEKADTLKTTAKEKADTLKTTALGKAAQAKSKALSTKETAKEKATQAKNKAKEAQARVREDQELQKKLVIGLVATAAVTGFALHSLLRK